MAPGQGEPPKFAADRNLGRLAKWLRLLGYDATFLRHSTKAALLFERNSGRLVLTRLSSLQGEPGVVFVAEDDPREQLRSLAAGLNLRPEADLSRCSVCNTPLEPAPPEEVEVRVPEHVRLLQRRFHRCPACQRIYWPGSHVERIRALLLEVVGRR
jgi:hypothetical protein